MFAIRSSVCEFLLQDFLRLCCSSLPFQANIEVFAPVEQHTCAAGIYRHLLALHHQYASPPSSAACMRTSGTHVFIAAATALLCFMHHLPVVGIGCSACLHLVRYAVSCAHSIRYIYTFYASFVLCPACAWSLSKYAEQPLSTTGRRCITHSRAVAAAIYTCVRYT